MVSTSKESHAIMKYLVLGDGWIGNIIASSLGCQVFNRYIGRREDVPDFNGTIINCIGRKGFPNIDWCEDHKQDTFESNVLVPYWISTRNKHWIHISSGCIYNGYEKEWTEKDPPNFFGSFYSRTKAMAEDCAQKALILRIRIPLSPYKEHQNILTKLDNYKKVIDAKNSVTLVSDIPRAIKHLEGETGIYNLVSGVISYKDLVPKNKLIKIEDLNTKAPRSNCILSNTLLKKTGFKFGDVKECIRKYNE